MKQILELRKDAAFVRNGFISKDIAFGGVFYAQIDVERVGLRIVPEHARALAEAGTEIKALLAEQVAVEHPEIPGLDEIAYVMFRDHQPDGSLVTCTTLKPGRVDRSPCGTGSCSRMAALYTKGELAVGEECVHESVLGTRFTGRVMAAREKDGLTYVTCRLGGRAHITGFNNLVVDHADRLKAGFQI